MLSLPLVAQGSIRNEIVDVAETADRGKAGTIQLGVIHQHEYLIRIFDGLLSHAGRDLVGIVGAAVGIDAAAGQKRLIHAVLPEIAQRF